MARERRRTITCIVHTNTWVVCSRHTGSWSYPGDFSKPEELPCAAVYSFVLTETSRRNEQSEKKWPSLVVGGIECASLGQFYYCVAGGGNLE